MTHSMLLIFYVYNRIFTFVQRKKKFSLKTSLNENSAAISTPSFCTSVSVIRILTSSSAHAFLREFHFLLQKYFVAVCVRKVNKKNHMTCEKIIGDDSFAVTETVSAKYIYFIFLHSSSHHEQIIKSYEAKMSICQQENFSFECPLVSER